MNTTIAPNNIFIKTAFKCLALGLALSLAATSSSWASASFGQASDFFNEGAGARPLAMGGAFTGLANDASAPYYNPAGLTRLDEHQLLIMHAPLYLNTDYNYFSSAHPLGDKWGSLGISASILKSDGFEIRDQFNNLQSSNGEANNNAIYGFYAKQFAWDFSAGANLKYIQQKVAGYSGSDLGLDVGFMYDPTPIFNLGVAFANINSPSITLKDNPDKYRPITRLGVASQVFRNQLILTGDLTKVQKQDTLFAVGAEYAPVELFSLRGGYNANRSYTFGVGFNIKDFRIDYAFSNTDIGAFNKFSLTWAWHNIYETQIDPPIKEGRAVYPLSGFENQVAFHTRVPSHVVSNWTLEIRNAEGTVVKTLDGNLRPPEVIEWDARNEIGEPVVDGTYSYKFLVDYKNGKSWVINGDIALVLPKRDIDEVIDMDLQLNGSNIEGEEARTPVVEEKIEEDLIEKQGTAPVQLERSVSPAQEPTVSQPEETPE